MGTGATTSKIIKYSLLGLFGVAVALALAFFLYLKSIGIIPRKNYDSIPPEVPDSLDSAVLIFSKTNGFVHKEAIPVAKKVLRKLSEETGKDVFVTDNAAVFNEADLSRFSIVIWNNVSGDVLTEVQRNDFRAWLESGGGWLGLHASGGDFYYKWDWYVNSLLRAQFVGHNMKPQFQTASVLVEPSGGNITSHLGNEWVVENEEWYAFESSPERLGSEIVLRVDEASYNPSGRTWAGTDRMDGDHPVAWRHRVGKGKVFYSAVGHRPDTYYSDDYQALIKKAIYWLEQ